MHLFWTTQAGIKHPSLRLCKRLALAGEAGTMGFPRSLPEPHGQSLRKVDSPKENPGAATGNDAMVRCWAGSSQTGKCPSSALLGRHWPLPKHVASCVAASHHLPVDLILTLVFCGHLLLRTSTHWPCVCPLQQPCAGRPLPTPWTTGI